MKDRQERGECRGNRGDRTGDRERGRDDRGYQGRPYEGRGPQDRGDYRGGGSQDRGEYRGYRGDQADDRERGREERGYQSRDYEGRGYQSRGPQGRGDDRGGGSQGRGEYRGYRAGDERRGGYQDRTRDREAPPRGGRREDGARREVRPEPPDTVAESDSRRHERPGEPPLDDAITSQQLDRGSRDHLKALSKETADVVARHLVAAGVYLDTDPERAHLHALAAQRRAGRIDIVREAVAITAYHTGRYADALREARTVRRLSGEETLRAIEADSERGLGRPERALAVIAEADRDRLPADLRTELAIVESGARADLGEYEAGLLVVEDALGVIRDLELRARLLSVKADRLDELGRSAEADAVRALLSEPSAADDSVLYIDDTVDEAITGQSASGDEAAEEPGPHPAETWDDTAAVGDDESEDGAGRSEPDEVAGSGAPTAGTDDVVATSTEDEEDT